MLFVNLPLLLTKFFPVAIIKLSSTLSAAVAVWARRRIGNPVQIRNGTATVCVQAPHAAKASHWELSREGCVQAVKAQVRRPAQGVFRCFRRISGKRAFLYAKNGCGSVPTVAAFCLKTPENRDSARNKRFCRFRTSYIQIQERELS